MVSELIDDRGRIVGTRITVYNLMPYFIDPTVTEAYLCRLYELTPEQIAAARAYVVNNSEAVWARHREIEARNAKGNPPEIRERAEKTRAALLAYKEALAERRKAEAAASGVTSVAGNRRETPEEIPTIRESLSEADSRPVEQP